MAYSYGEIAAASIVAWFAYQWILFTITERKVRHIPTIGSEGFISSYLSAWRFLFKGHEIIQEGYEKYHGTAFKVPTLTTPNRWLIVVSGPKILEDIRKASENQLSFRDIAFKLLHIDSQYAPFKMAERTQYQVEIVRGPMTRALVSRFEDVRDEIVQSFNDLLPPTDNWASVKLVPSLIPIICRSTNRLFVGLPLCRHPEYLRINDTLTIHLVISAHFLNLLPGFLRLPVGRSLSKFPKENRILRKFLVPMIEERMALEEKLGRKYEGRPNDLISWMLDSAPKECRNVDDFILRIILLNFAAIHTTSITLGNTLFCLAPRPEYIEPLRAEIEEVINQYGWTKEAMGKMRKLDSFIRESSRFSMLGALSANRIAKTDYQLSNGVMIPAGFRVAVAAGPTHLDPDVYEDARTFKGFRFAEMRDGSNEYDPFRYQMVSLDSNFLFFGHGRSACPGRFFAVNEVKAMLSHILLTYDIKMPEGDAAPSHSPWFAGERGPNPEAQVLFRKRQSV